MLGHTQDIYATPLRKADEAREAAMRTWRTALYWAGFLAVLVIVPFVASGYQILQATHVLNYAVALLGLNILLGYNGQLSLGHGAFCGAGAYLGVLLMNHAGLPYWTVTPVVALVCLLAGFLFGLPALRLQGHYLALATFALALAVPQLLKHPSLAKWTGGFMGVTVPSIPVPAGLPLDTDQWLYFLSLVHTIAFFLIGWNLVRGGTGRAMIALRDHPAAALAMGIDSSLYKSTAFGLSAMYAGTAGALELLVTQFASPDNFDLFLSIGFVVGVVVGGVATISGAIFGAFFIQFVPDFASEISKSAPWAVYGAALIVFMFLLPRGMAGLLMDVQSVVRARLRGFRNRDTP